jgi:hypothetical protein
MRGDGQDNGVFLVKVADRKRGSIQVVGSPRWCCPGKMQDDVMASHASHSPQTDQTQQRQAYIRRNTAVASRAAAIPSQSSTNASLDCLAVLWRSQKHHLCVIHHNLGVALTAT